MTRAERRLRAGGLACARRRGGRLLVLAWVLIGLGGCAVLRDPPQTAALQQQVPAGLPQQAEQTDVPFFPQTAYHCGPAALATVLTHAGLPAQPEALADAVFLPGRQGSLQLEMLAAARRHGAVATRLPPSLPALLRELAAGHPVLVLQNLGLAIAPRWHYAVVVGYDLPQRTLLLRSGTTEREVLPLRTFEHTWARGGHWAFVALPPGNLPQTATEADATAAVLGFGRVAAAAPLGIAWRSVHQRWPGAEVPAIGLANALHAGGDSSAAADVLQAALQHQNGAALWNNLARLHLALGRPMQALDAAQRALTLAATDQPQWLDAARDTLAAVQAAGLAPAQP